MEGRWTYSCGCFQYSCFSKLLLTVFSQRRRWITLCVKTLWCLQNCKAVNIVLVVLEALKGRCPGVNIVSNLLFICLLTFSHDSINIMSFISNWFFVKSTSNIRLCMKLTPYRKACIVFLSCQLRKDCVILFIWQVNYAQNALYECAYQVNFANSAVICLLIKITSHLMPWVVYLSR